jgi:glycosyltransferase involved in cell wall biosynthesis
MFRVGNEESSPGAARVMETAEQLLVSFIIPARNEEKIIGACLDAICQVKSHGASWECLLVDNGSIDDTVKIGAAKGARVFSMPDVTISALRNFGAGRARGEFLAFIDADCVIGEEWLTNALSSCMDPTVGCVGSHPQNPHERSWVQNAWALQNRRIRQIEDIDWLPSMNILVKREAFLSVKGFNEALKTCEDVDFCYRLRQQGYRIVSDLNVRAVHYGEAKTIAEFFRKELWRSQSNVLGLLSHGLHWPELPSILLPFYYLIFIASLPLSTAYLLTKASYLPLFGNICAIVMPPCFLAVRTSIKARKYRCLLKLAFLYLVYAAARALGTIPVMRPGRLKDA